MTNWKYIQIMELRNSTWDDKKHRFIEVEPFFTERLWSDSVFFPDQRYNLKSLIKLANEYMESHKNISKLEYFEIRNWDLNNYQVLYKNY